ncbi:MAG: P-II family nitrogen regulator, partial [Clostridia bacterium]|nr:P-II family nitrogen regulator [Clostridia bacterium]
PIKSIGGAQTMAYLTDNKPMDSEKPKMEFAHELIYVILNEGYSDMVMDAARPAGAGGGTVISAKGTMIKPTEKFHGMSIADEKEVVLIVASAKNKADIMRAIMEKAGAQTKAGAVCFSLPVSQVAGLRRMEEEDE